MLNANGSKRTGAGGRLARLLVGPATLCAALALALATAAAPAAEPGPMERERLYEFQAGGHYVHPRIERLAGEALGRDDGFTRVQALREVTRYELEGLADRVVDLLGDDSAVVRTAAAEAADAIDAHGAAEALLAMIEPNEAPSRQELEQALLADRVLARWGDDRGAESWARRVTDGVGPAPLQVSAARALGRAPGAAGARAAWEVLAAAVVETGRPAAVRLAAADALAELAPSSGEAVGLAERLIESGGAVGPLLGARLLRHGESSEAIGILRRLAVDREPAVQAIAMRRMLELDPSLLWDTAEAAFASVDPKVRRIAVESFADRRQADSIAPLADMLNDPHTDVRTTARGVLRGLSADEALRERTVEAARAIVDLGAEESERLVAAAASERTEPAAAPHWRATEQAAVLLGDLDDKASADRLVRLFEHHRLEAARAAVAALRPLEVPETHGPVVELLERMIEQAVGTEHHAPERHRASWMAFELNQTAGVLGIEEADPLLRRQIPKDFETGDPAREAAIWALGLLHEPPAGEQTEEDAELSRALIGRINDMVGLNPERPRIRLASAIALGRMRAQSRVDTLRARYQSDPLMEMQDAARWAVMNITGEELPPIVREPGAIVDAFISPIDPEQD